MLYCEQSLVINSIIIFWNDLSVLFSEQIRASRIEGFTSAIRNKRTVTSGIPIRGPFLTLILHCMLIRLFLFIIVY